VIASLDPTTDPAWASFVESCPDASIYHHPAWLRLLRDQYGLELAAVGVEDEHGELVGGLPLARTRSRLTGKRLVALPFSDMCGPLLREGQPDHRGGELVEALRSEQQRLGVELEVREEVPLLRGSPGDSFYHHTLALQPDVAAVRARFSKSHKSGINKGLREGMVIERSTDRAALDDFYRLHVRTRRHQGVPTQPRSFIRRFERLFADGLGFVITARFEERPIAACVFLTFNGTVTYKYGASDRKHLSKRPNNVLLFEGIRWGCENGMARFDFGRTDLDNEGLRSFKRGFGTDERMLSYTRLSDRPRSSHAGARAAAPSLSFVIRRSPPMVGRLVGALFYKHAA
jgi:CelD/BcsL family acetyltransferase involved in cellulose biosynthesis